MILIGRNNTMKNPTTNKDKHLKAIFVCFGTVILLIALTATAISIYLAVLINTKTTIPAISEYSLRLFPIE